MKSKTRKPREVRPTIPVQWTKDDPDGKERFERACGRIGAKPGTVARTLCDAWAEIIMKEDGTAIEKAAAAVAKKLK